MCTLEDLQKGARHRPGCASLGFGHDLQHDKRDLVLIGMCGPGLVQVSIIISYSVHQFQTQFPKDTPAQQPWLQETVAEHPSQPLPGTPPPASQIGQSVPQLLAECLYGVVLLLCELESLCGYTHCFRKECVLGARESFCWRNRWVKLP